MHRNIKLLKWFNFFCDFRLYAPIAIIYFSKVTGSFALGMSIFSITMISSALLEIPTGIFSDWIGRRRTVTCGAVALALSIAFYALGNSFLVLAIGAILEGLSRSFYSGNNDALLHDTLTLEGKPDDFAEYSGKISAMSQFALAISAVCGGLIAAYSFSVVIWISVLPQLICVGLSLLLVDVPVLGEKSANMFRHLSEAISEFIHNPKLRLLSLSDALNFAFSESMFDFVSAFYQTLWPVWALGLARVIANLGAMVGFQYSGKILKRLNSYTVMIWSYIARRAIFILGVIFPGVLSPLFMSTTSFPWAVMVTAQSALMQKEFTPQRRATMASLNSFLGSMLFGVFSFVIGKTADLIDPARAIFYMQIASLSVVLLYWRLFQTNKKE